MYWCFHCYGVNNQPPECMLVQQGNGEDDVDRVQYEREREFARELEIELHPKHRRGL